MSGEYAVLAGAPALVMATNRRAHCTLTTAPATTKNHQWRFASSGFSAQSAHSLSALLAPEKIATSDPARLCAWVVKQLMEQSGSTLPENVLLRTDTSEMYFASNKLGLGSSAALTTALAGTIWQLAKLAPPTFMDIHRAHQGSQNGVGSGLDVATSLTGGLIRFQAGISAPAQWPDELAYRFIYAGKPASTPELVGRFNVWRSAANRTHQSESASAGTDRASDELDALIDASATLANRAINLDNFARYINALKAFDEAATIGIFSAGHAEIAIAAERSNVLYKPCGAGGGDLGVALSESQRDLNRFTADIRNAYAVIDLEIASHGLTIG